MPVLSRTIDAGPARYPAPNGVDGAVFVELAAETRRSAGRRVGLYVQNRPDSGFSVQIAIDGRDASDRHATRTLEPGESLDTTGLLPDVHPQGKVSAYTDPSLDESPPADGEPPRPGRVYVNVTEFTS